MSWYVVFFLAGLFVGVMAAHLSIAIHADLRRR